MLLRRSEGRYIYSIVYCIRKNHLISGPVLFKPTLFTGQLSMGYGSVLVTHLLLSTVCLLQMHFCYIMYLCHRHTMSLLCIYYAYNIDITYLSHIHPIPSCPCYGRFMHLLCPLHTCITHVSLCIYYMPTRGLRRAVAEGGHLDLLTATSLLGASC